MSGRMLLAIPLASSMFLAGVVAVAAPLGTPAANAAATTVPSAARPDVPSTFADSTPRLAAGLVVRYRPGSAALDERGGPAGTGSVASDVDLMPGSAQPNGFRTIRFDQIVSWDEAAHIAATVRADPRVLSAEPDGWATADSVVTPVPAPNDPQFAAQQDLASRSSDDGSIGVQARYAWAVDSGTNAPVIAVIDTGYTNHPDLAGRFVAGYDMLSEPDAFRPAVANDGGGRDTDASDPGDWVTTAEAASGRFKLCTAEASSWHGTHVAGTIGAIRDNAIGIAGIVANARIQPVRVLGKCGGPWSDIAAGITWASGGSVPGVPANATPARVLNLSLGGAGGCPDFLQAAIDGARARGSAVVAAAGNHDEDAAAHAPANCAGVVTVAATAADGHRAGYSNFGPAVSLAAPGGAMDGWDYDGGILSTLNTGTTSPASPTYARYQGTSMATPHVAAAAALLLSAHPTWTPDQVALQLEQTATRFPGDPSSEVDSCLEPVDACGAGILDLAAALGADTVPGPVSNAYADISAGAIALTFGPPTGAVTDYRVILNGDPATAITIAGPNATLPLDPDGYVFRVGVAARNAAGFGPSADAALGHGEPSVPTSAAVSFGSAQATVTWTASRHSGLGPIQGYRVTVGDTIRTAASTATALTIAGLTNGQYYRAYVAAFNDEGDSLPAMTAFGMAGLPGAPAGLHQIDLPDRSRVTWSSPSSGAPATGYLVALDDNWLTPRAVSGTSTDFTGLQIGETYRVSVVAKNAVGTGPIVTEEFIPAGVPSVPRSPVATTGNGSFTLTWVAPASDNLSAISGYQPSLRSYDARTATWSVWQDAAPVAGQLRTKSWTGLANGTRYQARVHAINAVGAGPWTGPLEAVPAAAPGQPSISGAVRGDRSATLTWRAPAGNGSAVTGYVVRLRSYSPSKVASAWKVTRIGTVTSHRWTGLSNGVSYDLAVSAVNARGTGSLSALRRVVPAARPTTPGRPAASSVRGGVLLRWGAARANGTAITRYRVQVTADGRTWRSAGTTSAAVRSLQWRSWRRGRVYAFRVAADSAAGAGAWSSAVFGKVG